MGLFAFIKGLFVKAEQIEEAVETFVEQVEEIVHGQDVPMHFLQATNRVTKSCLQDHAAFLVTKFGLEANESTSIPRRRPRIGQACGRQPSESFKTRPLRPRLATGASSFARNPNGSNPGRQFVNDFAC